MSSRIIKTKNCRIWLDKYGILHSEYFENTTENIKTATENIQAGKQFTGKSPYSIVVDIRPLQYITKEARQRFAEDDNSIEIALLVKSPLSRMLGNFFLRLHGNTKPVKLFEEEKQAIHWIKKRREKSHE